MTNKPKPLSDEEFDEMKDHYYARMMPTTPSLDAMICSLIATVEKWKNKHDTVLEKYHPQDTDAKIGRLQKVNASHLPIQNMKGL